MRKTISAIMAISLVTLVPFAAQAAASKQEKIGVGAGAVVGAAAGGPVGLIVGAAVGAAAQTRRAGQDQGPRHRAGVGAGRPHPAATAAS